MFCSIDGCQKAVHARTVRKSPKCGSLFGGRCTRFAHLMVLHRWLATATAHSTIVNRPLSLRR